MPTIEFKPSVMTYESNSTARPVMVIEKMNFKTTADDWVGRLRETQLIITFACVDSKGKQGPTTQQTLSVGGLISPYHTQPIFDNRFALDLSQSDFSETRLNQCKTWNTSIEVRSLDLKKGESFQIVMVDADHVLKRLEDWQKRVAKLLRQIASWLPKHLDLKYGTPFLMNESMLASYKLGPAEITTADIYHGKRLILTIKPKGLWIIGANGRIDLISRKGLNILIDKAEAFKKPDWTIYSQEKTNPRSFDKDELLAILEKLV